MRPAILRSARRQSFGSRTLSRSSFSGDNNDLMVSNRIDKFVGIVRNRQLLRNRTCSSLIDITATTVTAENQRRSYGLLVDEIEPYVFFTTTS